MATYEAGVFKDKHYDTLLDAQNDPTIEDRMTCFIAGKLYYKFGGVFQEVKMEIHNGSYTDLTTIGSVEVPNPIIGVPYLFFDPDTLAYHIMSSDDGVTFGSLKLLGYDLLLSRSITYNLIDDDQILARHIAD